MGSEQRLGSLYSYRGEDTSWRKGKRVIQYAPATGGVIERLPARSSVKKATSASQEFRERVQLRDNQL
jgi:hypothetical protein